MGDGGALLLGLLMAASTMVVGGRTDTPVSGQTFFFFAPVFIPLVILGVPDPRHRLRHRAARPHAHQSGHRRQGPPAPSTHAARPRAPAQRVHPVGLDRAAVGVRALPDLHRTRATASCRSASPRWAWPSTRCCTRACARSAGPTTRRRPSRRRERAGAMTTVEEPTRSSEPPTHDAGGLPRPGSMRADIVPGATFPDYELSRSHRHPTASSRSSRAAIR